MTTRAARPAVPGGSRRGQLAGVAADHLGGPGRAVAAGVGDVGGGDAGPAVLVLDAEAVAAEVDGLDQGGADAAHRVGDQVPGLGVAGDRGGGDRGQHLGRVRGRFGQVPAAPLGAGVALGGRPHRQAQVRAVGGAGARGGPGAGGCHERAPPPGLVKTSRSSWTGLPPGAAGPGRGRRGRGGRRRWRRGPGRCAGRRPGRRRGRRRRRSRRYRRVAPPGGGGAGDDREDPAGAQHPLAGGEQRPGVLLAAALAGCRPQQPGPQQPATASPAVPAAGSPAAAAAPPGRRRRLPCRGRAGDEGEDGAGRRLPRPR